MKKFVTMYAEVGEFIKSNPRILGVYDTKEDAVRAIIDDMHVWVKGMEPNDEYEYESEVDEGRMIANVGDNYCYWNVEEIQM